MTLEEYNLLSVDSKEEFINSGGIISSITSAPSKEKNALPSLDSIEEPLHPSVEIGHYLHNSRYRTLQTA